MTKYPPLPDAIEVLPGTPLDAAWERFEVFEALHYGLRLCNPFDLEGVQRVVAALAPSSGERMLDVACGHGELLIQAAESAGISGTGLDLSPWVLLRAEAEARSRGVADRLRWVLGRGTDFNADSPYDIVTGLGMSWIWDGFRGTLSALAGMTTAGGRIAFGDLQRITGESPEDVPVDYDPVLSRPEQLVVFDELGLEVEEEIVPGPGAWSAYDEAQSQAVAAYLEDHPGPQAEKYRQDHLDWVAAHRSDTDHLTWTVWIVRKPDR